VSWRDDLDPDELPDLAQALLLVVDALVDVLETIGG
jgi:hypothetical protein